MRVMTTRTFLDGSLLMSRDVGHERFFVALIAQSGLLTDEQFSDAALVGFMAIKAHAHRDGAVEQAAFLGIVLVTSIAQGGLHFD